MQVQGRRDCDRMQAQRQLPGGMHWQNWVVTAITTTSSTCACLGQALCPGTEYLQLVPPVGAWRGTITVSTLTTGTLVPCTLSTVKR